MEQTYELGMKLLTAFTIGLLVGTERGWRGRDAAQGERVAGVRTFTIVGLMGGVAALLAEEAGAWMIAAGFIAVAALTITAHARSERHTQNRGTTSAFATMLTFLLAAWSTYGDALLAIATTIVVTALLSNKNTLHRWLQKIAPEELYSGIKLLLISAVVLPLLPNEGFGPWQALNPYWIWLMVVLISALSFAAYVATRIVGKNKGTLITAIAGGLVSSTAVTLTLAKLARAHTHKNLFVGAMLLAAALMLVRVAVEVAVVNHALLSELWLPLTLMGTGILLAALFLWFYNRRHPANKDPGLELQNPLQLGTALKFGAFLAAILLLSEALQAWQGDEGVYVAALLSGLVHVSAITLSLAHMAQDNLGDQVAVTGIVLAVAMNTLMKGVYFAFMAGLQKNWWLIVYLGLAMLPGVLVVLIP